MKNGVLESADWIARFAVLNLLWLTGTIPVWVTGYLAVTEQNHLFFYLLWLISLIVLFFPMTTALFCVIRDMIMRECEHRFIVPFLIYFKDNFSISLKSGGIISPILIGGWVNLQFMVDRSVVLFFSTLVIFGIVLLFTLNLFSVLSHYSVSVLNAFEKAWLVMLGNVKGSLILLIILGILFVISFSGYVFLILFFTGSIAAFLSFSVFYRFYLTTLEQRERSV